MASAVQAELCEVTGLCGRARVSKEPIPKPYPIETLQEIRACGGPRLPQHVDNRGSPGQLKSRLQL